jgi:hypothetical protein
MSSWAAISMDGEEAPGTRMLVRADSFALAIPLGMTIAPLAVRADGAEVQRERKRSEPK